MIAVSRLARIGGLFAVGLAALVAGTGQAFANTCSLSMTESTGAAGDTLTFSVVNNPPLINDDLSGVTSVTFSSSSGTQTVTPTTTPTKTSLSVTVPTKPAPVINQVLRTNTIFGIGTTTAIYGSTGGGDNLAITGTGFSASVTVTLVGGTCNGDTEGFNYTNGKVSTVHVGGSLGTVNTVTDTQVSATTPPGLAGVVDVVVATAGGVSSGNSGASTYAYIQNVPNVNGVGPPQGLTTISTSVAVTGQNFIPGVFSSKVPGIWSGQPASFVTFPCTGNTTVQQGTASITNTGSINLTAPQCDGPTAVVNVTVTTPAGTSSPGNGGQYQFVKFDNPTVTSLSATSQPLPGGDSTKPIVISGTNFIGTDAVFFGTIPVSGFQVNGAGSITVFAPQSSTAGTVDVTVRVKSGTGAGEVTSATSAADQFTYTTPAPTVSLINPITGPIAGGTTVTIFGQFFTDPKHPGVVPTVTINGVAATNVAFVTGNSDSQITAVTPAGTVLNTPVDVKVTTANGTGTLTGGFSYGDAPPTITTVAPANGSAAGGDTVVITGTSFAPTDATAPVVVLFGGTAATVVSSTNTSITVTTPAHTAGVVDVTVQTTVSKSGGGNTTLTGIGSSKFTYSSSPPTVTAISPAQGPTQGGTLVTITGTNFNGTPRVTIGGVTAQQVTFNSATGCNTSGVCTLTAVTPAGVAGTASVSVTTSFGGGTSATPIFTFQAPGTPTPPAPTVTALSPASGTPAGSTLVTITGTNFIGVTSVTFGGKAASGLGTPSCASPPATTCTMTVLSPPGVVNSVVAVAVTTLGGTSPPNAPATNYQYLAAPPSVTSVNPTTGTNLGGTVVTISGVGFVGTTSVTFNGVAVAAGAFTVLNDQTIQATTPPGAPGAASVVVTTPNGVSGTTAGTHAGTFTYVAESPPTIAANGISPATGDTAGGTLVTITGTNFANGGSVMIGGKALPYVLVSATTLTVTTVAHDPGAVNVVVTMPAGSASVTNGFTYVAGLPTVTGITPNHGPLAGGTSVTISGTNLTGETSILIGGLSPTSVTINNPGTNAATLTVITPAHATPGPVNVSVTTSASATTTAGTAVAKNLYTYDPVTGSTLPTVTSVSPNTGVPGGGTSVTITGTNFTNVTAVMFGATNAGFFTIVSTTSITARSPAGSGTVHVTVTTSTGTSATGAGDQFSYAKATTTMNLTSSPNPSNIGQAVTFTAHVTGNNPTGLVTFTDNGSTVIGTATLMNGLATLTIATLSSGSHSVTASYPGDANNAADPETVVQVVNAISDSVRLRQMQMATMPVVTTMSGQAISGAIDSAISAGFSGNCGKMFSPNGGGFTYCYDGNGVLAEQSNSLAAIENNMLPEQKQMLDDDFKALGYSEDPAAARKTLTSPREWLVWFDMRGAGYSNTTVGSDLKGTQLNGTAGITRKFGQDFLVGVLGGYEHFDFASQAYNGKLTGDGYTAGGYVGVRLAALRFDASGAWSEISAADSAGTASGNFTGHRWFAGAGVTGTFDWSATVFEPSARVYMLWEQENAYTDSLGTLQGSHTFDTGRGSAGMKVSHSFPTPFGAFAPYVGFYGDYYFSKDDATTSTTTTTPAATTVPLIQGAAARATGGVTMMFGGGAQVSVGGEYSGLAQDSRIWNLKLQGSVPF